MSDKDFLKQSEDYRRIEGAIHFLEENFRSRPSLEQVAESVQLSKARFNRLFKRWAGIGPVEFFRFLTPDYTRGKLMESGLADLRAPHGLSVTFETMTPGEFKRMGAGLEVQYGVHLTPFGECLLAVTGRGICHLGFSRGEDLLSELEGLRQTWPLAVFTENMADTGAIVRRIFGSEDVPQDEPFHLLLKGTSFQMQVWQALVAIPRGHMVCYQDLAVHMGRPKAFRAVAGAIAVNPVGYLIPCHRVIAKSGKIHHYRWGGARKKAILGWEAAQVQ